MNHERWLLLLALLLLMTPTGRGQKEKRSTPTRSPGNAKSNDAWVEQTLRRMTLDEKLGQLIMVYYFGEFTSAESVEYKNLVRQVEDNRVGGFILGARRGPLGVIRSQVYPAAILANDFQRRATIPLFVAADFEAGTGMRLVEGTSFPSEMAVAATANPHDAYTVGKITAIEARAMGVNWIFSPVADVNINPQNPIINTRSYGEDPERMSSEDPQNVADFVTQFIRGVQENGALATAKHFPGHGDVSTDSHLGLPVVPADRERLESVEFAPFRSAIAAHVGSVMTGHLAVPALEPDRDVPATLSKNILTGVLRDELGFRGIVVTDAMDMRGLTTLYPPGEAAVRSISAGADVLLIPPNPDAALAALKEAVKSGRIPIARIDESVRRILRAKASLGLSKNRFVDIALLSKTFARPEFEKAAQDIADRGVTLLRDSQHILPLDSTKPLRLLMVALSGDPDPYPAPDLEQEIRPRVDALQVLRADTSFANVTALRLPPADSYDAVLAVPFVRVADRKGNVSMPSDQAEFLERLLAGNKPVIVACFGSPYLIERFPEAKTWIAAFGTQDVVQRAMGRALFGQVTIGGQIPVSVPSAVKRGDGFKVAANPMTLIAAPSALVAKLRPAEDLLEKAVADRAFPGGVLAVGFRNQICVYPFGRFAYSAKSPAVTADTIYDVASLTKPVVTTSAVMLLAAAGQLDLDAPISRYLPEWTVGPNPAWRQKVTVRDLLLHNSGLPAHRDYYRSAKSKSEVLAGTFAEPLVSEPGTKVEYSDLGFILLGEIVERLTGESLDEFAREKIFTPLAMRHSLFNPPKSLRAAIAPTEDDTDYRQRQLQGEVDDDNAFAMGGVAGHAGLFSTAGDLSIFAQLLLNGGIYAHQRLFSRSIIRQFTTRVVIGDSARTLGWDVPAEPSSTGSYFSGSAFGHSGFTGTSLWIDPANGLFVILLTNRVYPSAENNKIRQIRPALHDAIVEALGLVPAASAHVQ
ncbi:MAG: glycoside hydrolase family 3 N-terminal domain-containing protein [Candidatus Acidiferrales bacterium]